MNITQVSDLFRDYLSSEESITAGVPDNDTLKKRSLTDLKEASPPHLLVDVQTDPDKLSTGKVVYTVVIIVTAEIVVTTREQCEEWLHAVKDRLREPATENGPEFGVLKQWILDTYTDEQRTGWALAQIRLLDARQDFSVDSEKGLLAVGVPMSLTLWLS